MRECPECGEAKLRKISHISKDFRCGACRAEFAFSKGVSILSALCTEFAIVTGIVLAIANQSWLIFLCLCVCIPIAFGYLLRGKAKLKLVGLRAKLKEKGL